MTLLNITLFCEFGVLKCIYVVQKHIFHILYIYCSILLPHLFCFTKLIALKSAVGSDWLAIQGIVIG